jgi:hypothetical protein
MDGEKLDSMKNRGFVLIPVPYWWDEVSLIATILSHGAELMNDYYTDAKVIADDAPFISGKYYF